MKFLIVKGHLLTGTLVVSLLLTDRAFHFGRVFGFVGAYKFVLAGFNFFGLAKCRVEMFVGLMRL